MQKRLTFLGILAGFLAVLGFTQTVFAIGFTQLAYQVWAHAGERYCTKTDNRHLQHAQLAEGVLAEIIHVGCVDACGSGGCISFIVVGDRVYSVFGGQPFIMSGLQAGESSSDHIVAIAWFGYASSEATGEYCDACLLTLFWSPTGGPAGASAGIVAFWAADVTEEFR